MASAQIFTDGNFQGVGTDGLVVPNGKLYIYDNATGLLATTYQDSAQTITNVNPVILSASGKAKVFLSVGVKYDITLKTSADVMVWTLNDYIADDIDAILSARTVGTIAALRTTVYSVQPFVSVTGYHTASDNIGVREYYWDAASTEADNGGTIIQVTGVATGRWKMKYSGAVNVKWFGAKGDGVTDDTSKLNAAALYISNNSSLYFPSGTYIADSGCVLIRGKTNIDIHGDGESSIIKVSGQTDSNPTKQDYHTTMAIDQCSYVTLSNIVIESKGANYGNTDAYSGLSNGDPRTNAIINYGGSALLISRSNNITCTNVTARRCGSVGVIYLTSSQDVKMESCFANARSLGYAGFAVDNWADATLNTKRTYSFINCSVSKEDALYSSKGGIVAEGDQIAGRTINITAIGCTFEDVAIGSDAVLYGAGITALDATLIAKSITTNNCYMGIHFTKRGGSVNYQQLELIGSSFNNNKVTGIYINISTTTGGSKINVSDIIIQTDSTSVWAASSEESVKYSTGIVTGNGYQNGDVYLSNINISGCQYGVYSPDRSILKIISSSFNVINYGVKKNGGGYLFLDDSFVSVTATSGIGIYQSTSNIGATASYNSFFYVNGNTIAVPSPSDSVAVITGNSTLFSETVVVNNVLPNGGIYSISKGSATKYDTDVPSTWTPIIVGGTTPGTYEINSTNTKCTYLKMGKIVKINAYIQFAAVITGGGAGSLTIQGVPFPKRANSSSFGLLSCSGITYSAGKIPAVYFGTTSESSNLIIWETSSGLNVTITPITAVAANSIIAFSISYETN